MIQVVVRVCELSWWSACVSLILVCVCVCACVRACVCDTGVSRDPGVNDVGSCWCVCDTGVSRDPGVNDVGSCWCVCGDTGLDDVELVELLHSVGLTDLLRRVGTLDSPVQWNWYDDTHFTPAHFPKTFKTASLLTLLS